jgi:glyoxylase-like metal-dependent hydrolase (beta-lactamase superfamily II)
MSTEVSVLLLGEHQDREKNNCRSIAPISSSATLVQHEGTNILVDTGFYHKQEDLLAALKQKGLRIDDIHYVVNTHYHFDHCGNNFLFSKVPTIVGPGVWQWHSGQIDYYNDLECYQIPGIEMVYTPGHDMWHWAVFAEAGDGSWAMAGDAVGYGSIMSGELPAFYKRDAYLRSAKLILEKADKIVPGHGKVIEGETRQALISRVDELMREVV